MTKNAMLMWGFLLLLVFAAPRAGDAQVRIAVSAGPTFATLGGDDARIPFGEDRGEVVELGSETGFFAGASLSVPLGGILSVSPGVYFVQKGTTFDRDLGFQSGSVELSYVEVPVTIGVAVTGANLPVDVSLFAGPEVSFELDCTLDFDSSFSIQLRYDQLDDCQPASDLEEGARRKSVLYGLVFGAEVSYRSFLIRGGLDMGLTSLDDTDADEDFSNRAWFLGVGYVVGG